MGQSMFIVWRESVEALLVIGILHAWLSQQPDNRHALRMLWGGVAAGLGLATLLAWGILRAGDWLAGPAGEWFQCAMLMAASLLILQMVGWMHHHGRDLKRSLIEGASAHLSQGSGIGLLVLAMLAVAREGSETVVFLYGIGHQQQGTDLMGFVIGGVLGFILALLSYAALQAGSRLFSWKHFFKVSEALLLLLGAALLMAGLDRFSGQLMGMDIPEVFYSVFGDPLWDTSALLDDGGTLGSTVAGLTGYRAMPSLAAVVLMGLYWLAVWAWLRPKPEARLEARTA
ncbi:FTR1 family iron permease [Pseudomonas sp. IC_126]|uniref:FTR1 family iron permease n=1 Tax=Pseudomonas sp. IC_126 TaxID=2547400 RepID=UPI00103E859D|nr:FTR1 family protein [Pseudomonas sp. IC_126]TCD20705.1 FTR1 family iron permease [Pseudomonas sp. IC_126]